MFRIIGLLLLLVLPLLVLGCQQNQSNNQIDFSEPDNTPNEPPNDNIPIRIAVSTVLSATDMISNYREIADYIGDTLNRPAILIQRKSYNEISNLMINGGADIAFLPTGAYITYGEYDDFEAIVMQERMGVPYYNGYIVVREDSNFSSINDLKGKDIAFTDPTSYSGYIFLERKLTEIGETPQHFFGNYNFTYHHENTLNAVIDKIVDGAAVNSLAFERAKLEQPELLKDLKIIEKSEPIGTGPVVIKSDLSKEDKNIILESFLTMHEQDCMLPVLEGLYIDKYVPFDPKLYEVPNEMD